MREKLLTTNPISHNVKGTQKLDEFIKELLSDNKKTILSGKNTEMYLRESRINFRPLDQTLECPGSRMETTSR